MSSEVQKDVEHIQTALSFQFPDKLYDVLSIVLKLLSR